MQDPIRPEDVEFRNIPYNNVEDAANLITVNVRKLDRTEFSVEISPLANVLDLKCRIEQIHGESNQRQRLVYLGRELENDGVLQELNIQDNCVLHMVLRNIEPDAPNNVGGPGQFGVPVHGANPPDIDTNLFAALRLCRYVRLFALLEGVFFCLALFTTFYPVFIVAVMGSFIGYLGATQLRKWLLYVYILYNIVEVGFRVYMIRYPQKDEQNKTAMSWLILTLLIFCILFIIKCCGQIIRLIGRMSDDDRVELLSMNSQSTLLC